MTDGGHKTTRRPHGVPVQDLFEWSWSDKAFEQILAQRGHEIVPDDTISN